jgi:hypothetical protein
MQNYYSLYTWAMDRQAEAHQHAANHRLLRQSRHLNLRLRWPIRRRRDDVFPPGPDQAAA